MHTGQWGTWSGEVRPVHASAHLLIGVPGTQVGEQVVLLIKIQGADKALELGPKAGVTLKTTFVLPLLVESLHVSQ